MEFTLLDEKQIFLLSEEELHRYLQEVKTYKDFIQEEVIRKREVFDKIIHNELFEEKAVLSERNKNLIEELKNML